MAKENKKPSNNINPNGNLAHLPSRCPVDGCNKKAERSEFCMTHFEWFKEGLVNREGLKPKDFDKKYQAFMRRNQKAA